MFSCECESDGPVGRRAVVMRECPVIEVATVGGRGVRYYHDIDPDVDYFPLDRLMFTGFDDVN
jgi:hypothetical protein